MLDADSYSTLEELQHNELFIPPFDFLLGRAQQAKKSIQKDSVNRAGQNQRFLM